MDENAPEVAAALHPENLPAAHRYGCVCDADVQSTQARFTYSYHFGEHGAVTQHMLGLLRSSLCTRPLPASAHVN